MNYKRILIILAISTLSLTACGKDSEPVETSVIEESVVEETTPETVTKETSETEAEPDNQQVEETSPVELFSGKASSIYWTIRTSDCESFIPTEGMTYPYQIAYPENYIKTNAEGEELLNLTKDMIQDGKIYIPVTVTDSAGTSAEQTLTINIVDETTAPDWYSILMESELYVDFIDFMVSTKITTGKYELNTPAFWERMHTITYQYLKDFLLIDIQPKEIADGMQIANELSISLTEDWKTADWAENEKSGQNPFIRGAFYSGFSIIPKNVLQSFQTNGGNIVLTDIPLEIQDSAGYFIPDDLFIKVTTSIENSNDWFSLYPQPRMALAHEIGHYVDYQLGWISSSENWKTFYQNIIKEFENIPPIGNAFSMEALSLPLTSPQALYRDYSLSGEKEFFADTFYLYCEYPDSLKNFYPDFYEAMKTCIEQF